MSKNNTGTIIRTAKSGFLDTYNQAWRQTKAGDVATQLLCITAVGTHRLMKDGVYTSSRQAERRGQKDPLTVSTYQCRFKYLWRQTKKQKKLGVWVCTETAAGRQQAYLWSSGGDYLSVSSISLGRL